MVNSIGFILLPRLLECTEKAPTRFKVLAKRFLDDDAVDALCRVAAVFDVFRDRDEDGRWERKVEHTVDIASRIPRFDFLEMFPQVDKRLGILVATGDIGRQLLELVELCRDGGIIIRVLDVRCGPLLILFGVHLCAGVADDMDISGEITDAIKTEQGGIGLHACKDGCRVRDNGTADLLLGQVARSTKHWHGCGGSERDGGKGETGAHLR